MADAIKKTLLYRPGMKARFAAWVILAVGLIAGPAAQAQDPAQHAKALSQAFRQAAREVQPAVVTIISHYKQEVDPLRQLRQQRNGRPDFPREGELDEHGQPTNVGSGVIFD